MSLTTRVGYGEVNPFQDTALTVFSNVIQTSDKRDVMIFLSLWLTIEPMHLHVNIELFVHGLKETSTQKIKFLNISSDFFVFCEIWINFWFFWLSYVCHGARGLKVINPWLLKKWGKYWKWKTNDFISVNFMSDSDYFRNEITFQST